MVKTVPAMTGTIMEKNAREDYLAQRAQRRKGGGPQFMVILLCALAALREISFLKWRKEDFGKEID